MANEKEQASYIDEPHVTTPGNPAAGYTRVYRKSDNQKYKKTSAGVESADGGVDIDGQDSYGSPPDESLVFLAQSIGTSDFWKLTGDEMRRWLASAPAVDLSGVDSRALQAFAINSTTDRTISIASSTPAVGQQMRIYAVQVSGGTGHKVLLPTSVYFGHTGTNRAALFDTAGDYLDALCFDIGGTLRFLVFANNGVTFAAS